MSDIFVVFAREAGTERGRTLPSFVIDARSRQVVIGPHDRKMGQAVVACPR